MVNTRADAVRNREKLVAAAADMFADHGVDVPLEDIAKHAGVSIGTLYNHFPNRGALLDAALPDWALMMDRLAEKALADPDPWNGFAQFMVSMFEIQAGDRAINDAIARGSVGPVDVEAQCGRSGVGMQTVLDKARQANVVRADFGPADLVALVWAMSQVIAKSEDGDDRWLRHLGFVLDGLRA